MVVIFPKPIPVFFSSLPSPFQSLRVILYSLLLVLAILMPLNPGKFLLVLHCGTQIAEREITLAIESVEERQHERWRRKKCRRHHKPEAAEELQAIPHSPRGEPEPAADRIDTDHREASLFQ